MILRVPFAWSRRSVSWRLKGDGEEIAEDLEREILWEGRGDISRRVLFTGLLIKGRSI